MHQFQPLASGLVVTHLKPVLLTVLLLVLTLPAYAQEDAEPAATPDVQQIRECARANLPDRSFSQRIELSSRDAAGGERTLIGHLYGETRKANRIALMLSVEAPQDLAGARYLLNRKGERDDMYVFLPALQRTRRIMGSMRGQPLWGTDFSYEDIKHLQSSLGEADTELLGVAQVDGRSAYQLRVIPLAQAESAYTAVEIDIDQQTCLLLQARFFDSSGVIKRMHNDPQAFMQQGERWVPGVVRMEHLRSGTTSLLKLSDYMFDEDLSKNRFNPKSFHLAR